MKSYYLIGILLSIASWMYAQQDADSTVLKNIDEVVISATRTAISSKNISQTVQSISINTLTAITAPSTADILQKTGSITVQKSQQGGGSPILRGFEANKIVLVVDGVRMNNIIFRGGHLQNIITVDPNLLEKIEVLYGPSSAVYGSDALGGVIHLISKSPTYTIAPNFKSTIHTRLNTVNNEKMLHYHGIWGAKKTAALFSASYTSYGDLNSGRNKNPFYQGDSIIWPRTHYYKFENQQDKLYTNSKPWKQIASGFEQLDIGGKIKNQLSSTIEQSLNIQYSTSGNIPRYDRLTDPASSPTLLSNGDWYYGPQKRFLANYGLDASGTFPWRMNVNYQVLEESRHTRRVGNYNLQSRIEHVTIFGGELYSNRFNENRSTTNGLDFQIENVKSTAFLKNLIDQKTSPLDTRYPAGSNKMFRLGTYWIRTTQYTEKFSLQSSLRVGITTLQSDLGSSNFFNLPFQEIKQSNIVSSGNIGLNFKPNTLSKIGFVIASAFRAPNVDDVAKIFESVTGRVIVPNEKLKPEQSIGAELNGKWYSSSEQSWIGASVYFTRLLDAITIAPFQFNSKDSIEYNGTKSLILASQNNSKANVYGLSLDGRQQIHSKLFIAYNMAYTRGRILKKTGNTPLDHIPPLSGRFAFEYLSDKIGIEFNSLFNAKKDIKDYLLQAEDNEQYATPIGMPAWATFNFYIRYNPSTATTISLGLENILDTEYRVFASGINAPGRNLSVSIKYNF